MMCTGFVGTTLTPDTMTLKLIIQFFVVLKINQYRFASKNDHSLLRPSWLVATLPSVSAINSAVVHFFLYEPSRIARMTASCW